jgi:hypothetical protein
VFVVPGVAKLTATSDVPMVVPPQFHELIVYGAAMLAMMQTHREDGQAYRNVASLYADGLAVLRAGQSMTGRMRSERMR